MGVIDPRSGGIELMIFKSSTAATPHEKENMIDSITTAEELRQILRNLPRKNLLLIAERATEQLTSESLHAVFGDFIQFHPTFTLDVMDAPFLLDQVRVFHDEAMAGHYYAEISVDNRNSQPLSYETQAFIAEFDRLLKKCIVATKQTPSSADRTAFELLFALLRRMEEATEDFIFFADDGGIIDMGIDWRIVFPAYFKSLITGEPMDAYFLAAAAIVDEFANPDHTLYLQTAREIYDANQSLGSAL